MKVFGVFSKVLLKTAVICGCILFVLRAAGISADVILSGSMEPVLHTGGIVFTDTRPFVPEEGDIITYRMGGSQITHRIIQKKKETYVTKGDANDGADAAEVTASQILGRVVFSLPFLGYAVAFLQKKTSLAVITVLAMTGLLQNKGDDCRKRCRKSKAYQKGEHAGTCGKAE